MAKKREHRDKGNHGSWHHRVPRSKNGKNTAKNLVYVKANAHRSYHALFGNADPKEVARLLTSTWIDADMYLAAFPRKKKKREPLPHKCPLCGKGSKEKINARIYVVKG